jgi:Fic family protein
MKNNAPYDPTNPYILPFLSPKDFKITSDLKDMIMEARVELAELKGYSSDLPNQKVLLAPTILKESVASSGIENINTTMVDVLENRLFPEFEQRNTDKEVLRYESAINEGLLFLNEYSLGTRTITQIYKTLLSDASEGYRQHQVAIKDTLTKKTIYTPPIPAEITPLMKNLEEFLHNENKLDPLIKAAIVHYQFEAIHPFHDGNGRTGRILMVLNLVQQKVLNFPTLYISSYLLDNRPDYYKQLLNVTINRQWKKYFEFMLQGFFQQAKETKNLLFKIKHEYRSFKSILKQDYKSIYSSGLAEVLFRYPIVTPTRLAEELGCKRDTASNYLKTLNNDGILIDKRIGKYHFYTNKKLIDILYK